MLRAVCLLGNLGFEFAGADSIRAAQNDVLPSVVFAPLDGAAEALVRLVGTCDEDVEIYFLDYLIYVGVGDNLVNITDGLYHVLAIFGGVEHTGVGLVLEDVVAVLRGHYEVVAKTFGAAIEFYVALVQEVVNAYSEHLLVLARFEAGQLHVGRQGDACLFATGLELAKIRLPMVQKPVVIQAVGEAVLQEGDGPMTEASPEAAGIGDGLLGRGPVCAILEREILINIGGHVEGNALEVPLDGVLQVFLVDKVGTACVAHVATDFVEDEHLDILLAAHQYVEAAAFVAHELETIVHHQPQYVLESLLVFLQYVNIEEGFPGLKVIVAHNADERTERGAPVEVNLIEIGGKEAQVFEHDNLVHSLRAEIEQMTLVREESLGGFDLCHVRYCFCVVG